MALKHFVAMQGFCKPQSRVRFSIAPPIVPPSSSVERNVEAVGVPSPTLGVETICAFSVTVARGTETPRRTVQLRNAIQTML